MKRTVPVLFEQDRREYNIEGRKDEGHFTTMHVLSAGIIKEALLSKIS